MRFNAAIASAFEAGRAAWPRVSVTLEGFAEHVLSRDIDPQALEERPADILLAFACGKGEPEALRVFESEYLSQVSLYLTRFALESSALDDVRQALRMKLLVGVVLTTPSAAPLVPGILGYRGNGSLGAWLRVTSVRTAIDRLRGVDSKMVGPRVVGLDQLAVSGSDNPEMATVRSLYGDRVSEVLEQSLRNLDDRQKTLLRLSVVDGLNIDAIGAIYRVHRATVARWFVAIRARILQSMQMGLNVAIQPTPSEMRSLIGALRDEIHLSAHRILAASP